MKISKSAAKSHLFRCLQTDAPVTIRRVVDSSRNLGISKADLLREIREAESRGDITIDKDWRLVLQGDHGVHS